ncbi:MAG: hypothetical protein Q9202_006288 [Teloschistes flavicans]
MSMIMDNSREAAVLRQRLSRGIVLIEHRLAFVLDVHGQITRIFALDWSLDGRNRARFLERLGVYLRTCSVDQSLKDYLHALNERGLHEEIPALDRKLRRMGACLVALCQNFYHIFPLPIYPSFTLTPNDNLLSATTQLLAPGRLSATMEPMG